MCPIRTSTARNVALRWSFVTRLFLLAFPSYSCHIMFVVPRSLVSPTYVAIHTTRLFLVLLYSLVLINLLVPRISLPLINSCHLLSLHVLSCPRVVRHGLCTCWRSPATTTSNSIHLTADVCNAKRPRSAHTSSGSPAHAIACPSSSNLPAPLRCRIL